MKYNLLILLIICSISFANYCPKTKVVLLNDSKWTEHDELVFNRAKKRCKDIYAKLPCLKKFEKVKENMYHAICGK